MRISRLSDSVAVRTAIEFHVRASSRAVVHLLLAAATAKDDELSTRSEKYSSDVCGYSVCFFTSAWYCCITMRTNRFFLEPVLCQSVCVIQRF